MTDNTTKPAVTRNRSITFDSLRVHAAKLELSQKAALVKELKEQINAEVKGRETQLAEASAVLKDL